MLGEELSKSHNAGPQLRLRSPQPSQSPHPNLGSLPVLTSLALAQKQAVRARYVRGRSEVPREAGERCPEKGYEDAHRRKGGRILVDAGTFLLLFPSQSLTAT